MIVSFRNKPLRQFFEDGETRKLPLKDHGKIFLLLTLLSAAAEPEDLGDPRLRLHTLRGNLAGHWSIRVTANWRMTFRFEGGHVHDVDLVDYH